MSKIITLPDGYNGHTEIFYSKPIEQNEVVVKLGCASEGCEYLIKWVLKTDYERALKDE